MSVMTRTATPGRIRSLRRRDPADRPATRAAWVVAAVALVYYPLTMLFGLSFRDPSGAIGLSNYLQALQDPRLLRAVWNSIWTAGAITVGSTAIALPMAYLVSRTDLPLRRLVRSSSVLTFAAPSFIAAMGWILLLGPHSGLINRALQAIFGFQQGPFNIFSSWGIVFVLALFSYPLIFLPVTAALDNMDVSLEQAAANLGASRWRVLRRITFPLVTPAVLGGMLLTYVTTFVVFGPVALLGNPVGFETIPTVMLDLMTFPPRIETAAVMGVPVLAVLAVLLWIQRRILSDRSYAMVGGRPGRSETIPLGRYRWVGGAFAAAVVTLSIVLPYGVLVLTSFRKAIGAPLTWANLDFTANYVRLLEQPSVIKAFRNSIVLSVGAVVVSIMLGVLAAWMLQRTRARSNTLVAPTMLSPLAFPGAVLGIALILSYARPPFRLGGTLTILLIAYVIRTLPLSFTYVQAGIQQLGPEVEEAARNLGAGWWRTMARITVPLLKGPILSVALLNFVLLFRELEISVFLYTGLNDVAAVTLFNLATESLFGLMGALSVIILAINLVVVIVARRFLGLEFRA